MTFLKRYLLQGVQEGTIHQDIEQWQHSDSAQPLHEYLGLTPAEYELFQRDEGLFYTYLRTTKAVRKTGCG